MRSRSSAGVVDFDGLPYTADDRMQPCIAPFPDPCGPTSPVPSGKGVISNLSQSAVRLDEAVPLPG
jgi:hypothetical protein